MIRLPYGGQFDGRELVTYIRVSRRDYIIQGQQTVAKANHTKPHSLDYWLRQFANNPNTKQAEASVIEALVATGLFVFVKRLRCPDSGNYCRGLKLVTDVERTEPVAELNYMEG
ncbi:MAG: hypothetical protein ACHP9V_07170 [Terriglobales bacterium]